MVSSLNAYQNIKDARIGVCVNFGILGAFFDLEQTVLKLVAQMPLSEPRLSTSTP